MRIFYGRVYVYRGKIDTPENPLLDALRPGIPAEHYGHRWVIGNLDVEYELAIATARLGYFPELEEDIETDYDREALSFVDTPTARPHGVSAAFALHYDAGLLAFEEHPEIGPTGFVNHLVKVMNEAGTADFRGRLLRTEEGYKQFLNRVDVVKRVSFAITRPNPHEREIFRPLAEDLREADADRARRVYESDTGLDVPTDVDRDEPTDNPLIAGIEMVEEGYGDAYEIDAVDDGAPVRYSFSSHASDFRDEVEGVPNEHERRRAILIEWLRDRFAWLTERLD